MEINKIKPESGIRNKSLAVSWPRLRLKIAIPERKAGGRWECANAVICSGERGTLPPPPEPGNRNPTVRGNKSKLAYEEPE